jgi:hypothetical protein
MINYSSYNDAWGISQDILNQNNQNISQDILNQNNQNISHENNQNNQNISHENFNENINKPKNESRNINKCDSIEHILNCEKCLEKLKTYLNIETKETFANSVTNKFRLFNYKIKNILLNLCDNNMKKKKILLLLFILLFIILSFLFVKGRGIDSESGDSNLEALAEAVGSIDIGNMKYLKENFIMIPKNMINFNNIY